MSSTRDPNKVLEWYTSDYEAFRQKDWAKRIAHYKTLAKSSDAKEIISAVAVPHTDYLSLFDSLQKGERAFLFDCDGNADEVILFGKTGMKEKVSGREVIDATEIVKKVHQPDARLTAITPRGLQMMLNAYSDA